MDKLNIKESAIRSLQFWQPALDKAIADAAKQRLSKLKHLPNLAYDLRRATDEAWDLGKGHDLRYDRPSTGVLYALWYHPQRITTCLPQVLDSLLEAKLDRELQVYDLGAGTGAFQWAFALCAAAIHQADPARRHGIHVVNVDSSAIMLNHLEDLWGAFRQNLPHVADFVTYESTLNSYSTHTFAGTAERWITASYLFDHTDKLEEISMDFARLIDEVKPARVLLSTSKEKGEKFLPEIHKEVLAKANLTLTEQPSTHANYLQGGLPQINRLREHLARFAGYVERIRSNACWASQYHRNLTLVVQPSTTPICGRIKPLRR